MTNAIKFPPSNLFAAAGCHSLAVDLSGFGLSILTFQMKKGILEIGCLFCVENRG